MARRQIDVIDQLVVEQGMTYTGLAEKIGVDSSVFSKMKVGSELDFVRLVRVFEVCALSDSCRHELILLQMRPKNLVSSLEYATVTRDFALLEKLLQVESNKEVTEAQEIYRLFSVFRTYELPAPETLKRMGELKMSTFKNSVIYRLFLMIVKWHMSDVQTHAEQIAELKRDIRKLNCDFLCESLLSRLEEFSIFSALHMECDTEKVKRFVEQTKHVKYQCLKVRQSAMYTLATSVIFSDYEQAVDYFTAYCHMIGQRPEECVDIQFLKVYWNRATREDLTDLSEIAHWYAKRGEREQALAILDEIEPSPFRTYYRALATKDGKYLVQALAEFMARQEFFFARVLLAAGDEFGDLVPYIAHTLQQVKMEWRIR